MNNCKNCTFCEILIDDDGGASPGGMMFITYYKCSNEESDYFDNKMQVISSLNTGNTIDGRESITCDKYNN